MPGIDLNLSPDLQDACRRLSFSEAAVDSPDPSGRGRSNREPSFRRFPLEKIPEEGEPTAAAASAPMGTSLALAPPGLLQSQQPQAGVSAERMAEERRLMAEAQALFGEYQRQRQQAVAAEAALQLQQDSAASAPMGTSLALASPGLLQSQQPQAAQALFGECQRQRQHQQALAAEAALQLQLQLQQAWASAARLRSQEPMLYTVDGGAAGYETKWKELHPDSQRLLLQIEDKIREYRDDSELLDQCSHLADLSLCNMRLEIYASEITQEVESVSTIMRREYISIESLMTVIREIMRNTDCAIRSYVKLRPRFVHTSAGSANSVFSCHSGSSGDQTGFSQLLARSPNFHYYSSATRRPSPFLQHTVARFEHHLGECCKWIPELEQLVQTKNDKTFAESLGSLSNVMSNVHDYLIHVASKVEHIHQYVETIRTEYLNDRRCWGDSSDPFLEANNREAAQQEKQLPEQCIRCCIHHLQASQQRRLLCQ